MLNLSLQELEESTFVILLNTNLRLENPLVNSRLRKNFLRTRGQPFNNFTVVSFGQAINYAGYPVNNLGSSFKEFFLFIQGKFHYFNNMFFNPFSFRSLAFFNVFVPFHLRPALLVGGTGACLRPDLMAAIASGLNFSNILRKHLFTSSCIFNVVSSHLGELTFKELGLAAQQPRHDLHGRSINYFLGVDNLPSRPKPEDLVIFQGSHSPSPVQVLNFEKLLLLPTALYVERLSTYLNLEGRVRTTRLALATHSLVLSDVEVMRALILLKRKLIPSNFSLLNNFYESTGFFKFIINYNCCFFGTLAKFLGEFTAVSGFKLRAFSYASPGAFKPYLAHLLTLSGLPQKASTAVFNKAFVNYYAMDFYSRNSKIMGLCSSRILLSTFSDK